MKIAYITSTSFSDTDFPLIRELQLQGHEVYCFINVSCFQLRATLIDIKEQFPQSGVFDASIYKEFHQYEGYLNMSSFFVVNRTARSVFSFSTQKLGWILNKKIKDLNPDIIHVTRTFDLNELILYRWRKRIVLTIHDPFPHSGESRLRFAFTRLLSTRLIRRFVLLNQVQKDEFVKHYALGQSNVIVNRIGPFDYFPFILDNKIRHQSVGLNILFFGRISPYKGLEFLCQAMNVVAEKIPQVTLTVAGGGQMYFDISQYEQKAWLDLRNRYIPIPELVDLIDRSTICVCPYIDATQSGVITMAYSLGKPVVATNVGGLIEMVEDNKTGLLVPPRHVNALAEAIICLLKNKNLRSMMEYNIKNNYFINDRNWSVIAKKYIDFYRDVK